MEGTPYSLDGKNGSAVSGTRLDAAGDVGEVEPDFDAAEVGALGADGRSDACAEMGDFVHGGLVDFFLGVEAGAHGPFVEKMEERTGFVEADGLGVGE